MAFEKVLSLFFFGEYCHLLYGEFVHSLENLKMSLNFNVCPKV